VPEPESDFESILRDLADARCDFIVIGGVCAVLHGAPISTFDLDLIHSREAGNLSRLESALQKMGAFYRQKPEIVPDASRLDTAGHHLLMTRFGPLDLLGSTVGDRGYGELLPHSQELEMSEGLRFRVLDLPTLIQIKEELGRERDRAVLPILRRTLAEGAGS
jgi:hypothetical protein